MFAKDIPSEGCGAADMFGVFMGGLRAFIVAICVILNGHQWSLLLLGAPSICFACCCASAGVSCTHTADSTVVKTCDLVSYVHADEENLRKLFTFIHKASE